MISTEASSRAKPALSVIIAAYNEAENVVEVCHRTLKILEAYAADYEILLVNDGSQDDTGKFIDELAAANEHIKTIHHQENRGFGAALISGYQRARCDWIAPLPADGQIPPEELVKFFPHLSEADLVIGVRPQRPYSGTRKVLHFGMSLLTNILVGRNRPPSADSGIFRREAFAELKLVSSSGFANSEFSIKAVRRGRRVLTAAIETAPRMSGQSKVTNFRTILVVIWDMVKTRWSMGL